ncbi:unnamed protein product [Cunninghamella echinulata]
MLIRYLEPKRSEKLLREYVIHKVQFVVEKLWRGAEVCVFGSFASNIYLPDSDIDLTVQLPRKTSTVSSQLYIQLAKILETEGVSKGKVTRILKATVPVIKFEDKLTGLKVDIIMNSDNGVRASKYIQRMTEQYPGLRELTLIIKHYLSVQGLNEVFTGGLGGYATTCLVLSFLQRHPRVATGMINPKENLGVLLLDFFHLYGNRFRIGKVSINVNDNGFYYSKTTTARDGQPVFSIEDPLDSSNDIACKSYKANYVARKFRAAYNIITRNIYGKIVADSSSGSLPASTPSSPSSNHAISFSPPPQETRSSSFRDSSVLRWIGFIPLKMLEQRDCLYQVYRQKSWENEEAAKSFNFDIYQDE